MPQAKRVVESDGPFPRPLWLAWMREARLAGRKADGIKETTRAKWKNFEGDESWLFTTMEAIAALAGTGKIQNVVKEGERAGPGWRQLHNGSYVFQVPPCEATRIEEEVSEGTTLGRCSVTLTTATVPRSENTFPLTTAAHPDTVDPYQALVARWPHLPLYDDYHVYLRSKIREIILRNEDMGLSLPEHSASWGKAVNSDAWWEGGQHTPQEARERFPEVDDKGKEEQRFQHPLLILPRLGVATKHFGISEKSRKTNSKWRRGQKRGRMLSDNDRLPLLKRKKRHSRKSWQNGSTGRPRLPGSTERLHHTILFLR